ncbi:hypothetical protein [Aliivibrio fischeri]|uniref:DUF1640 domain-containing protein n=1 Tax=Aliivibrio fischeri TaxID=668 RepID=A0A510UJX3_ALIFS|nr:hypothetical protein [Aliivibrio fischeri]GEK13205.1 hypothetical protein AFI02nite_12410 [Aliivibrio fischeri]
MSEAAAPIKLTPEQLISLVGHGVTQEQLDSARRELGEKIDNQDAKIDAVNRDLTVKIEAVNRDLTAKIDTVNKDLSIKIDNQNTKIDAKFDKLDAKIDSKFNLVLAFLLANVAGVVALGFWLGQNVVK